MCAFVCVYIRKGCAMKISLTFLLSFFPSSKHTRTYYIIFDHQALFFYEKALATVRRLKGDYNPQVRTHVRTHLRALFSYFFSVLLLSCTLLPSLSPSQPLFYSSSSSSSSSPSSPSCRC